MRISDGLYWIATLGLASFALISLHLVWRSWRHPDNWRIDPEKGRIAFNNRKELTLAIGVAIATCSLFILWIA